jgi:hypothetical protein
MLLREMAEGVQDGGCEVGRGKTQQATVKVTCFGDNAGGKLRASGGGSDTGDGGGGGGRTGRLGGATALTNVEAMKGALGPRGG